MNALLDLTADLKDFLTDVPNERGVGEGMKAWAKDLLDRLNAASTGNILDVAPHDQETPKEADVLGRSASAVAERLQEGTATILDVANQGRGIAPSTESITVGIGGEATAIASPLYLLASEIVDVVEFAAQYRAEEEAAAEEGALIEASGYLDPVYERNGR